MTSDERKRINILRIICGCAVLTSLAFLPLRFGIAVSLLIVWWVGRY
jgi:hypothetical protein